LFWTNIVLVSRGQINNELKLHLYSAEMHVNTLEFGLTANPDSIESWRSVRNVFDSDFHEMTGSFFESEGNSPATIEIDAVKNRMLR
jgi:hypothetical protein